MFKCRIDLYQKQTFLTFAKFLYNDSERVECDFSLVILSAASTLHSCIFELVTTGSKSVAAIKEALEFLQQLKMFTDFLRAAQV